MKIFVKYKAFCWGNIIATATNESGQIEFYVKRKSTFFGKTKFGILDAQKNTIYTIEEQNSPFNSITKIYNSESNEIGSMVFEFSGFVEFNFVQSNGEEIKLIQDEKKQRTLNAVKENKIFGSMSSPLKCGYPGKFEVDAEQRDIPLLFALAIATKVFYNSND